MQRKISRKKALHVVQVDRANFLTEESTLFLIETVLRVWVKPSLCRMLESQNWLALRADGQFLTKYLFLFNFV